MKDLTNSPSASELSDWVRDARQRTLDLVSDLSDDQLMGAKLDIVNPMLWEIGHAAWFQEKWVLRHVLGEPPIRDDADALWDSMAIAHDTRWDLPLPTRQETLDYLASVRDAVLEAFARHEPTPDLLYHARYTVHHEDMHNEAFTYTRQTHEYAPPSPLSSPWTAESVPDDGGSCEGDVAVPGGEFPLGAEAHGQFVFDNEKWEHGVQLEPFEIARAPVTHAEYAAFCDDGGYGRREWWSEDGWTWRESQAAEHPVYWRSDGVGVWERRVFDRWVSLGQEPHLPVIHVNWHEANAYCRWAGRRLPTEAEWEAAAISAGNASSLGSRKRIFPWGNDVPGRHQANLDAIGLGCLDVGACAAGDSVFGCRQMIGNVWEWTDSDFGPYPGFTPDPYNEYSEPWFHTRKVLRGGCWATRSRMLRGTWRNFYEPHRRDVFAGFRTCAATG